MQCGLAAAWSLGLDFVSPRFCPGALSFLERPGNYLLGKSRLSLDRAEEMGQTQPQIEQNVAVWPCGRVSVLWSLACLSVRHVCLSGMSHP